MNENLAHKTKVVDEVREQLESSDFTALVEYRGVNVADMSTLRRNAREANVRIRIVKNTLARRAAKDTQFECLSDHLKGPLAIVTGNDAADVAKTIADFEKNVQHFKICVGALGGEVISVEKVTQIAKLPSRDELIAQTVSTMAAPIQRFLGTLNQLPTGLVRALAAVRDTKDS